MLTLLVSRHCLFSTLFVVAASVAMTSSSQEVEQASGIIPMSVAPTLTPAVSIEQYERTIADIEQSSEVTVDVKLQAIENYKAAIKNVQTAADFDARLQVVRFLFEIFDFIRPYCSFVFSIFTKQKHSVS